MCVIDPPLICPLVLLELLLILLVCVIDLLNLMDLVLSCTKILLFVF